ncbi:MAG: VTT domain-containing protein, partial [Kiritimatiellae bacterium]|nr:VTT domain-containing protein [Kiritimatiellia bacterium]
WFALVVMILVIALSTLISEDLACIGAGLMVAKGILGYAPAAFAAFLGIFLGDLLLFYCGRWLGRSALQRKPLCWLIREEAIQESTAWFTRRGPMVILLSRFLPGSRLPTFFAAGMLHTRVWSFALYFLVAGVIWAPFLVWLSSELGDSLLTLFAEYKLVTMGAVLAAAAVIWLVIQLLIPSFTFKGRRRLVSKWRRLTRWEFWPLWAFYPPVLLWIGWLAIRYRGLHVMLSVNPAMPLGGLIGESKKAILDQIALGDRWVAAYQQIPGTLTAEEKEAAVMAFLDGHGISFPVVLKPDQGQRGQGVAVVRSQSQVSAYFAKPRGDTLVQRYVPGYEVGVFYYRMPGMARGRIFSITEKRFPVVIGDGRHDLEYLILKDERAVYMAGYLLSAHRDSLKRILDEGEPYTLVELGTHCRGAVFQDGIWLKTPALERAMDEIAQSCKGFYFGRFDLRCPNLEDLKAGMNFKVIELNGLTSEATHIYNPGNTLWYAYGVLFKQWAIAFRIGQRNLRDGVRRERVRDAIKQWLAFQRAPEVR